MYTFAFVSISSQRAKRNQSESERNVYAPLHSEKSLTLMGGLPKEMNGKPQDKSPRSAICNSNCQPTNVGLWTLFVAPSNYRNTMENHPFPAHDVMAFRLDCADGRSSGREFSKLPFAIHIT